MKKLTILRRTNWEKKFYIALRADTNIMNVIKEMAKEMGDDDYFIDNQANPNSLLNYEKWKDNWIPLVTNNLGVDIVCGDKIVHLIFYRFPSFKHVNNILDKYCSWEQSDF